MSSEQLTLFVGAFPVRTYQWPAAARDWLESDPAYGLNFIELLTALNRDGLLSKTSPACYPVTEGETLPSSFGGWSNAGMASPGGYLTLNISEYHSDAAACSLSEVLETDAPPKYFLSAKAAAGILRRLAVRGRTLPTHLEQALRTVATKGTAV